MCDPGPMTLHTQTPPKLLPLQDLKLVCWHKADTVLTTANKAVLLLPRPPLQTRTKFKRGVPKSNWDVL